MRSEIGGKTKAYVENNIEVAWKAMLTSQTFVSHFNNLLCATLS